MQKQTLIQFFFPLSVIMALTSCSSIDFEYIPSQDLNKRIKYIVMHYSVPTLLHSTDKIDFKNHDVSAHYFIPQNDGNVEFDDELTVKKSLKETSKAEYEGNSFWQGHRDVNAQSIDINIANEAECKQVKKHNSLSDQINNMQGEQLCFYPDYAPKQIQLLIKLSKDILERNSAISPTQVVGHADISPQDKIDPGPRFPWYQLYQQGIGAWYDKVTVAKYWNEFLNKQSPNIGLLQNALQRYGYNIIETGEFDQQTQAVISAFQMHFMPWQITAQTDEKTAAVLFALLEKYFPLKAQKLNLRYQRELIQQITPVVFAKKGQVDSVFPQKNRSTRELVNDRTIFKSYRKRGQIIINNNNASTADIYVNGQKLTIAEPLKAHRSYQYSLKKRTKTGDNTLRVESVLPEGASINVTIPNPSLIDRSKHWRNLNRFKKIDDLINQDIKNGFPGAVLVVIKEGEILKNSAYGYTRKFADDGELLAEPMLMTTNTLFDIASNTKMFATNFAIMKLVSEGKLEVNKAIADYLPLYHGAGRETRLVKDILTHNAGYSSQVKFFTHNK